MRKGAGMAKLIVLGLGDVLSQDKGLGIYAVRDLYQDGWPEEVSFVHKMQNGSEFLLQECEHLLVLDTWSTGKSPGTLHRCTLQDLVQERSFMHIPYLWDALTLAELMGQCIDVLLLGLEPENTAYDMQLSSTLQGAYPGFLYQARKEMCCMLQEIGVQTRKLPVAYSE